MTDQGELKAYVCAWGTLLYNIIVPTKTLVYQLWYHFMPSHHMLSQVLSHKQGLLACVIVAPFIPLSYPRSIAFSSGSLSGASFDASLCELLLLKKLIMPARLPSGLVEKTLDRRLVPSAFNLTGYITSDGLPARRKRCTSASRSPECQIPLRMQPTNVSRTTNPIALFPLNGHPTVLRCRHPCFRLVCLVGW